MKVLTALSPMVKLHLSVLLLGVSGIFAKLIDLAALDIIAYRSLFTVIALGLFVASTRGKLKLNSIKDYGIATLLGVLAAIHWVTYFISIQKTSVAIGMIALFTYPVMTVLIEPLFRKKLPKPQDILLSLVVLLGISLLFPNLWQQTEILNGDYILGILAGLLSALSFALRNIGIQHYFKHYTARQGMFYQFGIAALLLLPFSSTTPIELSWYDIQLLIVFAIFFSALAHVLFSGAITLTSAKTAGLVACLQPLYGMILSLFILAEIPTWTTLLGGSIILSTAIYETTRGTKKLKKG